MRRHRLLLFVMSFSAAALLGLLLLAYRYQRGNVNAELWRVSPGLAWSEIEKILGPATPTDDLQRGMPAQGETRRGFWQLTENAWVLVGFDESGLACWVV